MKEMKFKNFEDKEKYILHLWTREHKLKFLGDGEWVDEEDVNKCEYRGYRIVVARKYAREPYSKEEHWSGGYLCGYVVIPMTHPLFGKSASDIDCWGGITFDEHEGTTHVIGFDCAHLGDYLPSIERMRKNNPDLFTERYPLPKEFSYLSFNNPTYKNMKFCLNECVGIVDQLIEKEKK
jgi:hypothetical protein